MRCLTASNGADRGLSTAATSTDASPPIPSRCRISGTSFRAFRKITQHHFNVDKMAAILFAYRVINAGSVCVFSQSGRVIFTEPDEGSRTTESASFVSGVCRLCPRPRAIAACRWVTNHSRAIFPGARTGQWSLNSTVPHLIFTCPGTSGPA